MTSFDTTVFAASSLNAAPPANAEAASAAGQFIIDPWLGLIGLCVLVITGAIAVIREIRIEDDENKS